MKKEIYALAVICMLSLCSCDFGQKAAENATGAGTEQLKNKIKQIEDASKKSEVILKNMEKMLKEGRYSELMDFIIKNQKDIGISLVFKAIKDSFMGGEKSGS